ncbi:MAG: Hsp20/alpha crystallin family protein, partial [Candidatus Hodarchaeales archaeon]
RVICELPGVEKDAIDLRTTESKMVLKATGENNRIYNKSLKFPSSVKPKIAKAKFKNGVLEIVFTKKNETVNSKKIPIN